jgi:hypothetical protein
MIKETINQENIRLLLPAKIARTVELIAANKHLSPWEVLTEFYSSQLYKELEIEKSKRWWESPLQLSKDYSPMP